MIPRCVIAATLFLLSMPFVCLQSAAQEPVELELVLAIDSSSSIEYREYLLQRDGLTTAFRDADVKAAIRSLGPDGLAVSVIHWAGRGRQDIVLDWTKITSDADADAFADRLATVPRKIRGFTDISGAILVSTRHLLENAYHGQRMTIDVSGDGRSDDVSPHFARDLAVAQGITINGLVIYSDEYDLGKLADAALLLHYERDVIGGQGSFVIEAEDFTDFANAIRRKLIREITGPAFADRFPPEASQKATAQSLDPRAQSRL